jgi:Xaa-Pro aminopeptidase
VIERLGKVQLTLRALELDGWLLTDFAGANRVARLLLGLGAVPARRWFYWMPADGVPRLVLHASDAAAVGEQPGERAEYSSWLDLRRELGAIVRPRLRLAMEYCPMSVNPFLSRADAGVLELVRSYGAFVVSSDRLVPQVLGVLDDDEKASHRRAAIELEAAVESTLRRLVNERGHSEIDATRKIADALVDRGLELASPAMVAFGEHTRWSTHVPGPRRLDAAEVVRVSAAARFPKGVVAEIARVGFAGEEVPDTIASAFAALERANRASLDLVARRFAAGRSVHGFEVDRAARDSLARDGLAAHATERIGHALGVASELGEVCLLDDHESHETRRLLPSTAFVLRPSLVLEEHGLSTSVCFLTSSEGVEVTGKAASRIVIAE